MVRLMVLDEETHITGGVDRVRFKLLPQLAEMVESLLWVVPACRLPEFRRMIGDSSPIVLAPLEWPSFSLGGFGSSLVRRLPAADRKRRWQRILVDARLRSLERRHRITGRLCVCVYNQIYAPRPSRLVGMIYDLNFSRAALQHHRDVVQYWMRHADRIVTCSHFTARGLAEGSPEDRKKITVIPLGAGSATVAGGEAEAAGKPDSSPPVFYYPAVANSHKGHLALFKAAAALARRGVDFKLVLTGRDTERLLGGSRLEAAGLEAVRIFFHDNARWLAGRIDALGYCGFEMVETMYQRAFRVVLPSAFEGFGLPLVEALERGRPVICSDLPPYLEQIELFGCADCVSVFLAGDYAKLADLMEQALRHPAPPVAREVIQGRLSHWTWRNMAEACLEAVAGAGVGRRLEAL